MLLLNQIDNCVGSVENFEFFENFNFFSKLLSKKIINKNNF